MSTQTTTIRTGFLVGNLFTGWDESEMNRINTNASVRKYAEQCEAALLESFPGAEIAINWQEGEGAIPATLQTYIDDLGPDSHEAEDVEIICGKVFEQMNWIVENA